MQSHETAPPMQRNAMLGNHALDAPQAATPAAMPPTFQLQASSNPIQRNINPDAPIQALTCYAHGFIPERDFFGNSNRRGGEVVRDYDYNGYWAGRNSEYARAEKEGDAAGMAANAQSIGEQFAERLKDDGPTYYFDGSAGALSSASSRMEYGKEGANQMDAGNITRKEEGDGVEVQNEGREQGEQEGPEPVVIIGHSMGAAYAAGIATRLKEINEASPTPKYDIKSVYYLAPHQPNDITHPAGMRGVQYSHVRDNVSSTGIIPFFSGSRLKRIDGVNEYLPFEKQIGGENLTRGFFPWFPFANERGGHNVGDHDYIFDEYGPNEAGYVRSIDE